MQTRSYIVGGLLVTGIGALVAWIANNTYWEDVDTRGRLHGEALTNPFYGAQHLAELLGAHAATRHDTLVMPPTRAVIVVGQWNWNLVAASRQRLESWVNAGGRLVVSRTMLADQSLDAWTGITQIRLHRIRATPNKSCGSGTPCSIVQLTAYKDGDESPNRGFAVCNIEESSYLETSRKAPWRLDDPHGHAQTLRIPIGLGSVTVVNAAPFVYERLLCGDNGRLFVATAQLHTGDQVEFLTEGESESLLRFVWDYGWPAVLLVVFAIALWLWKSSVRFGPLEATPDRARRSLAEQIRGTGQFTLRFGGGQALYSATARALEEAAIRHVPGYEHLQAQERVATLATLTGIDSGELSAALHNGPSGRSSHSRADLHEVRKTITVLEAVRRRLLTGRA